MKRCKICDERRPCVIFADSNETTVAACHVCRGHDENDCDECQAVLDRDDFYARHGCDGRFCSC